jgi:hypothetical protein
VRIDGDFGEDFGDDSGAQFGDFRIVVTMADNFDYNGLASTARPVRKKFAKPPVKVACLPW